MATPPTPVSDPRNATIASGKRAIQLATQNVQPPSSLYMQIEDSLQLNWKVPTFSLPLTGLLSMRWLRPDGEIVSVLRVFPMAVTVGGFTLTLGEGFLLSATFVIGGTQINQPGMGFASLIMLRDLPDTFACEWMLFADYFTPSHFPSWPNGRSIHPQEGPGQIRSITGTTPAAGAELSETVPANVRWKLIAFRATLATNANVANRQVSAILDDGTSILWKWQSTFNIVASQTSTQTFNPWGIQTADGNISQFLSLPTETWLTSGYRIRTITGLLQAGDQWSAPQYLVQEWVNL